MSEQDQVVPATNDTQETELEINLDGDDASNVETLRAELAKKDTAMKQILARARAAEELVKKSRETSKTVEAPKPSEDRDYRDEVYDLRLDGYSRDEAQFIMKNGGRKSLEENTFVKVAIEKIREQKNAEKAIPDVDSGKSDIERKYTTEQLQKMPLDKLKELLPHA